MKQLFPDLWQTLMETRFGTLQTHAYILQHSEGRDLIYVPESPATHAAINDMGGVAHIYTSHNHEISAGLFDAAQNLGAGLVGHANMQAYLPEGRRLDVALDGTEASRPGGLRAIHTPGHTDNNLCYLYHSPHGKTYLFTGDTLYLDHGRWKTIIMAQDGGNAADLRASLRTLRDLEVDVILTSVSVGVGGPVPTTQAEWAAIIDRALTDLPD